MQKSRRGAAVARKALPKLYNASRQIQVSKGLLPKQLKDYRKNPVSEVWRGQVSKDVVEFVDQVEKDEQGIVVNELLPQEKSQLFQNPSKYFSRPHNVPEDARKQIYFPNFAITLLRTPHLGPRYAQFKVPLWFGKLDLKSYLQNLYKVDVNHIRSFVIHRKKARKAPANRYSRGAKVQPTFKKKMTVELVDPFIWPEAPSETELNSADHSKDNFWTSNRRGIEEAEKEQAEFPKEPDHKHRRSIAQQAKDLLAGKTTWRPTWQEIPQDVRVLQGRSKAAVPSLR